MAKLGLLFLRQKGKTKKRNKPWLLSLLLTLLVMATLLPQNAMALSINGEGNGITGATSTVSGAYNMLAENPVGYRFALVDTTGATVTDTSPYDVYDQSVLSASGAGYYINSYGAGRFAAKHTKMELIDQYNTDKSQLLKLDLDSFTSISSSGFYTYDTVKASAWSLDFPETAADMTDWATTENMEVLLDAAWGKESSDLAANGWAVAIEPIYMPKIGGTMILGTVSELAILCVADGTAYNTSSSRWTATVDWTTSATSWSYISRYTNWEWPEALRLSEDKFGIAGGSNLDTLSSTNRGTAKELITGGYGMMLVYSGYLGDYLVKYNGNGATSGSMASSIHEIGTAKTLTANSFTKTGHTFSGWNTKADGSGI